MFSSSVNSPQAKNILCELAKLKDLETSHNHLYLASRYASVAPQNNNMQKVINYLSTWWGWGTNLSQLPLLTKKIFVFAKELDIARKESAITQEEVVEAIQGLGVLLNCEGKNSISRTFIEKAIQDLNQVVTLLSKTKLADSIPIQTNLIEQGNQNEGNHPENDVVNLATVHFDKCAYNAIEKNSSTLKRTIKSLLNDSVLSQVDAHSYEEKISETETLKKTLLIPRQFYVDCTRLRRLSLNGNPIYDQKTKIETAEKIANTLINDLGEKNFHYVGRLLQQALIADWLVDLSPLLAQNAPYSLYFKEATGFDFNVKSDGSIITIDAKIILSLKNAETVKELQPGTAIGYFIWQCKIELPCKEMEELDKLEFNQAPEKLESLMPSLKVSQAISPLYPTEKQAQVVMENEHLVIFAN